MYAYHFHLLLFCSLIFLFLCFSLMYSHINCVIICHIHYPWSTKQFLCFWSKEAYLKELSGQIKSPSETILVPLEQSIWYIGEKKNLLEFYIPAGGERLLKLAWFRLWTHYFGTARVEIRKHCIRFLGVLAPGALLSWESVYIFLWSPSLLLSFLFPYGLFSNGFPDWPCSFCAGLFRLE